ncbi:MAG: hypothetical protein AB1776_05455 [Bacillota bacterium]
MGDPVALARGVAVARAARLGRQLTTCEEEDPAWRAAAGHLVRRLRNLAAEALREGGPGADIFRRLREIRALTGDLRGSVAWRPLRRFLEEVLGAEINGVVLAPAWRGTGWGHLCLGTGEEAPALLYFDGAEAENPLMWPLAVRECLALRERRGDGTGADAATARLLGPALFAAYVEAYCHASDDGTRALLQERLAAVRTALAGRGTPARFISPWEELLFAAGGTLSHGGPQVEEDGAGFGPGDLQVAEGLLPRLAEGIFIAARPGILFRREGPQAAPCEDVYDRLRAVEEIPNTPAQIVNAGWLYYTLELLPRLAFLDFDRAAAEVAAFDALLSKSLLVAAVHRFFTGGETPCRERF